MKLEIYDKITEEKIEPEIHPYFKDYGVVIQLDGRILLLNYGEIICSADSERYGIRESKTE